MQKRYYSELNEISVYNFEKCLEGDYRFICKDSIDKWAIDELEAFSIVYEKFVQKYQKDDLENKVSLYKSIITLQDMYIQTRDNYFITQIEIKKAQLPKVSNEKKVDTTQTMVVLSKWMGFRLNPREISVDEFYSILKNYERANKEK